MTSNNFVVVVIDFVVVVDFVVVTLGSLVHLAFDLRGMGLWLEFFVIIRCEVDQT